MSAATKASSNGAVSAEAEAWVEQFIAGWLAPQDPESFADHFDPILSEDVRLVQPQIPTAVGRRAFREAFVRPMFALIPDLHATVHRWAASGEAILIEFTLAGTVGVVATRPRAWPRFARAQLMQIRQRLER